VKRTEEATRLSSAARGRWAGKTVVLGVTGSIAAYKAVSLVRRVLEEGAIVQVVMTHAAQRFVGALTFEALTGRSVASDQFESRRDEIAPGGMAHLTLAESADLIVIAPASAHCLAKLAHGLADDLLCTMVLAAECPVLVVPAMDGGMWVHPAVEANVRTLRSRGVMVMEPDTGLLASGRVGKGRFPEEAAIVAAIAGFLVPQKDFRGRRILITAGPTQEPLDPIRFISNRSSGKMGWALAEAARDRGAEVTLIAGPTAFPPPFQVRFVPITTSDDLRESVSACFADTDVLIMAAAVADFRPIRAASEKIPKVRGRLTVAFEPAPDILAEVSARRSRQILVGFAAETKELVKRARRKLSAKRLDLIVANDVTEPGAGFGTETNRVTMIQRDGHVENLPLMSKREVAHRVLDAVQRLTSGEKRAGLARTLTASSRPASKRRRAHNSQVR
jgi:phosphopantothenoylcysteine decarboxylase/phosphopantothenate--cysteine ligase